MKETTQTSVNVPCGCGWESIACSCGITDYHHDKNCNREVAFIKHLGHKYQECQDEYARLKYIEKWTIRFGKHKGKTFGTLFALKNDCYMEWLMEKDILDEKVKQAYQLYYNMEEARKRLSYCRNPTDD